MSKLPYLPLYVADYLLDTQPLSTNARGIWMDVLCLMWRDGQRGVMTKTIDDWCRTLRCSEADFLTAIVEFLHNLTCKVLKDDIKRIVRLTNRRMARESKDRKLNRLYVKRHRSKNACKDNVSDCKTYIHNQSHISESEEEKNKTKSFVVTSDEVRLSKLLADRILERKPDFKSPNLQTWAKSIDLMLRVDGRPPEAIEQVILWCQSDPFWQNNILSTDKLRKQFDQLDLKRRQGSTAYDPVKAMVQQFVGRGQ
jgi:uncharacterized protein YdaU (DUF1376 family)